jgi:tetratricopeptide (TPR) repeat protein
MELVQGVPITEYCDQCNLTTRERLELFVTLCQAVQHAHQKGIIHRDIKPTNVLVAIQDGLPTPKIIDFGVAKAINQQLTEHTLVTAFAQIVGTPLYMSPEQAELSPLGVDTRSDIFSLGVLLYELLTGTTPFDKDRLHSASYDELRRIIREEEPPRPSARLSSLNNNSLPPGRRAKNSSDSLPLGGRAGEGVSASGTSNRATTIAAHRRTDPRRLVQSIRGELDWIAMKCLEKDRNRRYESAGGLARDVERYLHDEPVQACPPSASYRFRKFARRNRSLLAAGGGIAAALLIGLGLATWMYVRATAQGARAKAVSDLLQEMVGSADAARAKGADYKVRDLFDNFARRLDGQLTSQPEVEADIRATIGRAYRSLKLPDKAQPHFERAIELYTRTDGPHSEKLAAVLVDGAWNLHDQGRFAKAESQVNEALAIYRKRGVTGGPLFHALEILQHILRGSAGREKDVERVTKEALAVARQSGEEFPDQANLMHRYADLKFGQGNFAEAEQLARQSVDMHYRLHGDRHPETAFGLMTLARALESQQKLKDAESAIREALAVFRHQFPEDHPNIRDTMNQLRNVLEARGDKSALAALAKEEAARLMRSDSPDYHRHLASLLLTNHPSDAREQEARRLIQWAIEGYGQMTIDFPDDLNRRVRSVHGYVQLATICAAHTGFATEIDEANRRLTVELPLLLDAFPDSSDCELRTALTYRTWAGGLIDYAALLPTVEYALTKSIEILTKMSQSDPHRRIVWLYLADTQALLGDVQRRAGRPADAEVTFRKAMEIYDQVMAKVKESLPREMILGLTNDSACNAYFLAVEATGREHEAIEFVRKAARHAQRLSDPTALADTFYFVALMQLRLGDDAGYKASCKALADSPDAGADDFAKARKILTWCFAPNSLEDMSLPVKRAEDFVAGNALNQRHFELALLGTALYRAGRYTQAAERLEESIAAYPSGPITVGFDTIIYQRLMLAMTDWQLGRRDNVRRLFAETLPDIDKELRTPSLLFQRRAALEIFRREAEALIGPNESAETMENGKPPESPSKTDR